MIYKNKTTNELRQFLAIGVNESGNNIVAITAPLDDGHSIFVMNYDEFYLTFELYCDENK